MTLQISTILVHFLDKCLIIAINIKPHASVLDLNIQLCVCLNSITKINIHIIGKYILYLYILHPT